MNSFINMLKLYSNTGMNKMYLFDNKLYRCLIPSNSIVGELGQY